MKKKPSKKTRQPKEVPWKINELEGISLKDFIVVVSEQRFDRINGVFVEIRPENWDSTPNPAYEFAQFGKVLLQRKNKRGTHRVHDMAVRYTRVMKGVICQSRK